MSNPGSPITGSSGSVLSQSDNDGTIKSYNSDNGNKEPSLAAHLDPVVRLNPLELNQDQLQGIKKKPSSGILLNKSSGKSASGNTASSTCVVDLNILNIKMEASSENSTDLSSPVAETQELGIGPVVPSIVKPRRPSVHFAIDSEPKLKPVSGSAPERSKQDGGSRKHRSRKEKLVCRSESPSDLGMEANESRKVTAPTTPVSVLQQTPASSPSDNVPSLTLVSALNESMSNDKITPKPVKNATPHIIPPGRGTPSITTTKMKSRVKRTSTGSTGTGPRVVGARKSSPVGGARKSSPNSNFHIPNLKEPAVKKKKVIEIVSPRKRKMDHLELLKTSTDPIFVRAANQPFKFKNKSRQNRLKFSRVNLSKSSGHHNHNGQQQRIRRASSASIQQGCNSGTGPSMSKQRLIIGSTFKKEAEAEPPCFPPALIGDLFWVLEDADKEFASERNSKRSEPKSITSHLLSSQTGHAVLSDPIAGTSAAAARFSFGRRRVESEPPGAGGFELAPGSPSGSQSFFQQHQVRKEVYFSPSPSYVSTGPAGRRRYSRRRHARIHPPFDDSNCFFQGHHCPNSKVPGSQYCEKHLDQGPTAGYSYCKYMKEGRQCGNLFSSFEPTITFCEQHSNLIAKAEHDFRNPKTQPDPAKNILAKINKILTEGLSKTEVDSLDSSSNADILQIIDEPEIIEDLSLGNFTGGLLEELDAEGERNVNPDKPDYDTLKNAGYYTTEEIIQIHVNKLRKLKAFYQREKELEWLTRHHKLRFYKEGLEKLKQFGPRFTTNPYLISKNIDVPKEYIDHQIKHYEAAKAILQTAYKADGEKSLLRLKILQKAQELARMAKASGQRQHDTVDICDSETDADSDSGEARDRLESSRYTGNKTVKCAYNEGYAIRACQNPPVCWSSYCYKHILSDSKQVQWIPCNRRIGPDPQDTCKTPCLKILQKHGCTIHAPLVMSKHKPLRRSEEELNLLLDSENEDEEVTLEGESHVLASLVSDECINIDHLDETINRLGSRGPLEITDTSDSEETDEEVGSGNVMSQEDDDDNNLSSQVVS